MFARVCVAAGVFAYWAYSAAVASAPPKERRTFLPAASTVLMLSTKSELNWLVLAEYAGAS